MPDKAEKASRKRAPRKSSGQKLASEQVVIGSPLGMEGPVRPDALTAAKALHKEEERARKAAERLTAAAQKGRTAYSPGKPTGDENQAVQHVTSKHVGSIIK